MKFIVCENYEEMSKAGAKIIADLLKSKPKCVLGLATGSTPVGMYEELRRLKRRDGGYGGQRAKRAHSAHKTPWAASTANQVDCFHSTISLQRQST